MTQIKDTAGATITVGKNGYHASDGKSILFTRDEEGRVIKATDTAGRTTSYAYDEAECAYTQENLVSSIQMMDKTVMAMEYDGNGRITSVEDANGNATEYNYTGDGKLTGLTDAIGTYQKTTYDSEGNITSTTNGAGENATYAYDKDGKVTSVTISREGGSKKGFARAWGI